MIDILSIGPDIGSVSYPIKTDYRNISVFLATRSNPDFTAVEKPGILTKRLYRDGFYEIPQEYTEEAIL